METTHPKSTQLEGAPTYLLSDLNVIQMMKRELFRAAAKNHSKDISPRLSDQAIRDFHSEGRVYVEPYWGTGKHIPWQFERADGEPWGLTGLWSEWADPATGEVLLSYTMILGGSHVT